MTHSPPTNTSGSEDRGGLSVADVLDRAADLIEPEGRWTQGYVARSRSGRIVDAELRSAVCWCGIGAVLRIARASRLDREETRACIALHAAATERGFSAFGPFNDAPDRTQAEVVAALRQAAAAERARATGSPS